MVSVDSRRHSRNLWKMPRNFSYLWPPVRSASGAALVLLLCSARFGLVNCASAYEATNSPLLSLDRIFSSEEFKVETYGPIVWRKRTPGYFLLEKPDDDKPGKNLVAHDLI